MRPRASRPAELRPPSRVGLGPGVGVGRLAKGGIAALLAIAGVACAPGAPKVPDSPALDAGASRTETVSDRWASRVLDDRERTEVREAMRSSAGGRTSAEVGPGPEPAPDGRWRDLPDAVASAGGSLGIAVVSTRFEPDDAEVEHATAIEFDLVTLASEPGRLRIERRSAPEIFVAHAEIGLFGQRGELASRFVESIREQVRLWGRKPELAPDAGVESRGG